MAAGVNEGIDINIPKGQSKTGIYFQGAAKNWYLFPRGRCELEYFPKGQLSTGIFL
jgi:hypothetical protein